MLDTTTQFLVDFQVHAVATALGLPIPPSAAAQMYGISEADYHAYLTETAQTVQANAQTLAQTTSFVGFWDQLGLKVGQKVLFIGDSITTYTQSYARLLATLLQARGIEALNRGHSGYTSTHGLELTYTQFLALQPEVVFIKYGVNDSKRFGGQKLLVSLAEYQTNLAAMIEAFQRHSTAKIVLLTPTLVIEEVVNQNPAILEMRLRWDNHDIAAYAQTAQALAAHYRLPCVDLTALPLDRAFYVADGLHPNALGHQELFTLIVNHLGN
jgi:lysophospholipase L1-like esterase